ncbi:type 1 glutamine amidotransferase [Streptomyces sp. NPDC020799]|uniref:type 1 glutamine amidotransferase n=1 Tax=Streptomyces sp. NPDC020799 TaxID=3365091 RepID=UPI00378F3249
MLVIQNAPVSGPGRMGWWLREAGLHPDVVRACTGRPLPGLRRYRGLIVLGGGFLPDEDEHAPWLPEVRRLVDQALQDGTPVLGICLGAQILAHVAGGTVTAQHGEPEHGSTLIRLRPAARQDALFGALPAVTPAIAHHIDAITRLPPDAVWLADSRRCPYQAFRIGQYAWGVQFHPEASPTQIRCWDPVRAQGLDPDHLYEQARDHDPAAAPVWRAFTHRYAQTLTHG